MTRASIGLGVFRTSSPRIKGGFENVLRVRIRPAQECLLCRVGCIDMECWDLSAAQGDDGGGGEQGMDVENGVGDAIVLHEDKK